MKRLKAWWQKICQNRKIRSGGFSVLLTVLVILLAMAVSALADGLENRFALQVDCSFNGATTQGEITKATLTQLNQDVKLIAVVPASGEDETLLTLLNRYDAASPHVTLTKDSLLQNPVLQTQYTDAANNNAVSDDCLIVTCSATGLTRILNAEDYVYRSYNLETGYFDEYSFSYEKSVTEAILFVTQDSVPTVQILTGHREKNQNETELMEETLVASNYQVKRVNLSAGDTLDPASPLMILCPQYDLSQAELQQLIEFAQAGGDFFITCQYDDPLTLENYNAFLRSYGIEMYPGFVVAKTEDRESYYSGTPVILMPAMQETDVTRSLLAAGENVLLVTVARAFRIPQTSPDGVMVYPLLVSGDAYIRHYEDGQSTVDQQPDDEEGQFAVCMWSDKMYENGVVSHALVLGDGTMFLDYWMQLNTSSTAFLLQTMRSLQEKDPVNLDIVPKAAQRESLSLGNITPAVIVAVMLPLLVLLGAVLVLWPRKNL